MTEVVSVLSASASFGVLFGYVGLFEYALHRWVLHRRWRLLPYPFEMHVLLHHRVFRGDERYHVQTASNRDLILFEWWQASLLLAVHAPVAWAIERTSGLPVFWSFLGAFAAYYAVYEYLHWCMHNPAGRRVERMRWFRYLDARHRLHHTQWHVNFNVVLPVGDLLFRTGQPSPGRRR